MEISTNFLVEYEWANGIILMASWNIHGHLRHWDVHGIVKMMGIQATQATQVLEVLENHSINMYAVNHMIYIYILLIIAYIL